MRETIPEAALKALYDTVCEAVNPHLKSASGMPVRSVLAMARDKVAEALHHLATVTAERDQLRVALRKYAVRGYGTRRLHCQECGANWWPDESEPHKPDCLAIDTEGKAHAH